MASAASAAKPAAPLALLTRPGEIYSHVRKKWLVVTPEETVRQEYLLTLVNEYGYTLDQLGEELSLTGRGSAQARADFVIWASAQDKKDKKPLIVVECKADNIRIGEGDYTQGEYYARVLDAPFFVTHNHRETRYWKVLKEKMPGTRLEIENIPHADDSDKEIKELLKKLRVFREEEFAKVLHDCHNIIRNRQHLDPVKAFDEIAKILFIKVVQERKLKKAKVRENLFRAELLRQQKITFSDPIAYLFDEAKKELRNDRLFDKDDAVHLKFDTVVEIVEKLEAYNLSDTSEDVKGIAFEKFLGRTFRGEGLGQFFTPRPVVEFMIRLLAPQEGEIILDPSSGSGGFLIRAFEIVRQQILEDADRQYQAYKAELAGANPPLSEAEQGPLRQAEYDRIQATLDQHAEGSRLWHLANRCLFGVDANERMARTSKMNMIMHGDGHGGVHHHNGLLNVNGIFENRFNLILTNPPFGASVEPKDKVTDEQIHLSDDTYKHYVARYGAPYVQAREKLVNAINEPIGSLFELGRNAQGKVLSADTETLFLERYLHLLAPGGRLGVVLPEGIFNNPSLDYVRQHCEDRARLLAVVSLPAETFISTGATVKCSLLFLQRHTEAEAAAYQAALAQATQERTDHHAPARTARLDELNVQLADAVANKRTDDRKRLQAERKTYLRDLDATIAREARALLKQRLDYPVFLYEAEQVGISATGETGTRNELYPNPTWDAATDGPTALELYQAFRAATQAAPVSSAVVAA
jgi:type I restriction enzyme M protein